MALPVILVNSATGSNTAASGAGPATALTGTSASTSGNGLVVTLDGSPDLSGVATDGSHVLWLNDTTTGARNFAKITAKDDGADTVTVSDAFGINLTGKSWAIGGKRASLGGSVRLFNQNAAAAGDIQAGWIVEMESGHTETFSAELLVWGPTRTSATGGYIRVRGAEGAATLPVLTWTNNGIGLNNRVTSWIEYANFELRNSNATKTASAAIYQWDSGPAYYRNLRIDHATNYFRNGHTQANNANTYHIGCRIRTSYRGVQDDGGTLWMYGCYVYECGESGLGTNNYLSHTLSNCIFANNVSYGVYFSYGNGASLFMTNCTVEGNGSHGVYMSGTGGGVMHLINNIFANNGGHGVNSGLSALGGGLLESNVFYGNTSGATNLDSTGRNASTADPQFANASGGDYAIGTNLRGLAWPSTVGLTSSYGDPGVAQRNEVGITPTYKALLVLSTYTFNPDHDTVSDVVAYEVAGGTRQTLTSRAVTQDDTNDLAKFTAAALTFPTVTTGQALGGLWIYRFVTNDSDSVLYSFHPCSGSTDGTDVIVTPPAAGFLQQY